MLKSSLKAVYYYHIPPPDQAAPSGQVGLRATQAVEALVRESLAKLPHRADASPDLKRAWPCPQPLEAEAPYTEWHQPVSGDDFLAALHGCFE